MRFDTEQSLIDEVVRRLAHLNVERFEAVPCLSRCIDLVLVVDGKPQAIEFKLRDWKRALDQAQDHRLAVDKTYVCLPPRCITPDMERAFVEAGVGLLLFTADGEWPFDEVVPAPPSDIKWSVAEDWLKQVLQTRRQSDGSYIR